MKKVLFTGCAVALVTPFTRDGKIDFPALDRLLDFQLENGTDGIVACGTTGEPATMTEQEWESVLTRVVNKVGGRVPVIAGTGGNCTENVIEKARKAKSIGADAQLCVTPYYNKTTQAGLSAHYTKIADETDLPLIIYNVPSRTGLNMKPEAFLPLMDHPRILGVKEASGDAAQAADLMALSAGRLALYSGSDELTVPLRALGGRGTISVVANIAPALMRDMTHLPLEQAAQVQLKAMKLIRLLFCEVNPIPVKAALAHMGLCENVLRLPLVPMTAENEQKLTAEMKRLEISC